MLKGTIKNIKREAIYWNKLLATHMTRKISAYEIYIKHLQFKKKNNAI